MPKLKKNSALAEAVSYAHLLPVVSPASAKAEDDDKEDDTDRTDAENGDDEDDKKASGKKAKKANADDSGNDDGEDDGADADNDDDDNVDADDSDDNKEDDDKKAGKKAKKAKAEDGDSDKDEDEDKASARAGAMRERARCAAIFGSKHAAGRPDLAAHLAFHTTMTASEAIGTMKTLVGGQKTATRTSLADRMRTESVPNPGQGGAQVPTGAKGRAAAILAASKKAHGG